MSCTKPELAPARDRYTTFAGIDFDGQTRRVIERIELHTLHASQPDPFWAYFHKRRHATSGATTCCCWRASSTRCASCSSLVLTK
jgi:hypothetical protein